MRGWKKKTAALALSLGLLLTSAVQTGVVHAESVYEKSVGQEKYSSTFTFEKEDLSDIEYALNNSRKNVEVTIGIKGDASKVNAMSSIKVPKSTIQAIRNSGKTAEFIVEDDSGDMVYAWKFTGGSMEKMADVNLALKIAPVDPSKLTDAITINSAQVQLKHTTELPKNTKLIIPVNEDIILYDLDEASEKSYYLYQLSGSKLSYVSGTRYKIDDDDRFTISIDNGGTYVLSPDKVGTPPSTGNNNTGAVQLQSYSGTVTAGATTSILVTSPATGSFSLESSNPAVAQVLGGGAASGGMQYNIKGLSAGTAVITVTAPGAGSADFTLTVKQPAGSVMIDTLSYNLAPGNIYDYKVTLQGASAGEVATSSSRPHIASVRELRRVSKNGAVEVYYRITGVRASADPVTVSSSVRGTHSSIRVMVTSGIRQHGVAARNLSYFQS